MGVGMLARDVEEFRAKFGIKDTENAGEMAELARMLITQQNIYGKTGGGGQI